MTARPDPHLAVAGQCRVPDFFVVGHPKCGTTALYEALRIHPQIFMSVPKEPHFMATELRYRPEWGKFGELPRTMDDYLRLFGEASQGQRVGESSAWYLWSRSAAAEIAGLQPEARIIAIIREPASFLRSLHLQLVQAHVEPVNNFREAMALESARRRGQTPRIPRLPSDWPQVLPNAGGLVYSSYVDYVAQLRRFHDHFAPENVLVLIYDDFRSDNEATVKRVLRFLDVDVNAPLTVSDTNPTVGVRSRRLNDLLHSVYTGRGPVLGRVKKGVKAVVPSRRLRRYAIEAAQHKLLYTNPEPLDEGLAAELRDRFKPEVVALSEYLDRDLVSLWGYDQTA
jgi:hypothetical protein